MGNLYFFTREKSKWKIEKLWNIEFRLKKSINRFSNFLEEISKKRWKKKIYGEVTEAFLLLPFEMDFAIFHEKSSNKIQQELATKLRTILKSIYPILVNTFGYLTDEDDYDKRFI